METTPMDGWIARVPEGTAGRVHELLVGRRVVVRLSRPRRSKLGDHRPPGRGRTHHRITVTAHAASLRSRSLGNLETRMLGDPDTPWTTISRKVFASVRGIEDA
jgi:hypothetical protein